MSTYRRRRPLRLVKTLSEMDAIMFEDKSLKMNKQANNYLNSKFTIFATSPALYQVVLARLVGGELAMERAEPPQTIISGN